MAVVTFYEKPGCTGNARQKALLEAAGHAVEARNLLAEALDAPTRLLRLLRRPAGRARGSTRAAPAVKSGEIVPENIDRGHRARACCWTTRC